MEKMTDDNIARNMEEFDAMNGVKHTLEVARDLEEKMAGYDQPTLPGIPEQIDPEDVDELPWQDEFYEAVMPKPETQISAQVINDIYERRYQAAFELWEALDDYTAIQSKSKEVEAILKLETAKAIADGRINGSNEDKRRAQARELFNDLYEKLEAYRSQLETVQSLVDMRHLADNLASWEIDRLNTLMKFFDIQMTAQLGAAAEMAAAQTPAVKTSGIVTARKL